jgi:hypothetical protein
MLQPQIFKIGLCSSNLDLLFISDLFENNLQDNWLKINLVL